MAFDSLGQGKQKDASPSSVSRRALLRGRLKELPANALRPPWLISSEILHEQCLQCGDCVRACPESILQLDPQRLPTVNFRAHSMAECTFCGDCASACPAPLFNSRDSAPWDNHASIDNACLSEQGVVCHSCKDACPEAAISLHWQAGVTPIPSINTNQCSGCGACVIGCPTDAINILVHPSSVPASEVTPFKQPPLITVQEN